MIIFYLLIGVMPLSDHPVWGRVVGEVTVVKYIGLVCLLYAVLHLAARRAVPSFFGTWQARFFLILYLIATISHFTQSLLTSGLFNAFLRYTSFLLLLFITVSIVDSVRRLRWVLLVAVGSVAFASLYVIREWQKYHNVYTDFRPGWVVGDPNYFTISGLLCLPVAFCFMSEWRTRWERLYCLGCLIVTLVGVTLGASRGGFLGLVAAFVFVALRSRHRVRNLALASVLVLPLSLISSASPVQRLLHPSHGDVQGEESRLALWKAGLRMVQQHPLRGIGLNNFRPLVGQYEETGETFLNVAHNTYLEVAAETGLPALLAFLAILYFSYRTLEQVRRGTLHSGAMLLHQAAVGIQAGLVGCAVAIFFVSGQYQKLLWLMVFLSMCLPPLVPVGKTQRGPAETAPVSRGKV